METKNNDKKDWVVTLVPQNGTDKAFFVLSAENKNGGLDFELLSEKDSKELEEKQAQKWPMNPKPKVAPDGTTVYQLFPYNCSQLLPVIRK